MKNIFTRKIYTEEAINNLCEIYSLWPTDCIKDDQQLTISDDPEGEPIWIFDVIKGNHLTFDRQFRLIWQDDDYLLQQLRYKQ